MRALIVMVLGLSVGYSQPIHPLHPSFLSGSVLTGYHNDLIVKQKFYVRLSADVGAKFSLFPAGRGAALSVGTTAEARYSFGQEFPKGYGMSAFVTQEFLFNPIFSEGERYEVDPLWSIIPGISLFWRIDPKGHMTIEPFIHGQCRFYASLGYDTGMLSYLGLDVGVRFSVSRKQLRGWKE